MKNESLQSNEIRRRRFSIRTCRTREKVNCLKTHNRYYIDGKAIEPDDGKENRSMALADLFVIITLILVLFQRFYAAAVRMRHAEV